MRLGVVVLGGDVLGVSIGVGDVAERGEGVHHLVELCARDAQRVLGAAGAPVAAGLVVEVRAVDAAGLDPAAAGAQELLKLRDAVLKFRGLHLHVGGVNDLFGADVGRFRLAPGFLALGDGGVRHAETVGGDLLGVVGIGGGLAVIGPAHRGGRGGVLGGVAAAAAEGEQQNQCKQERSYLFHAFHPPKKSLVPIRHDAARRKRFRRKEKRFPFFLLVLSCCCEGIAGRRRSLAIRSSVLALNSVFGSVRFETLDNRFQPIKRAYVQILFLEDQGKQFNGIRARHI